MRPNSPFTVHHCECDNTSTTESLMKLTWLDCGLTFINTQVQHVGLVPASWTFYYKIVLFHPNETLSPRLRLISTIFWLPNSYFISSWKSENNAGIMLGGFIHPSADEGNRPKDIKVYKK